MTRKEAERLAHAISQFEGEYVLTRGTLIVAHDRDLAKAMRSVKRSERKGLHVSFASTRDFTNTTFSSF